MQTARGADGALEYNRCEYLLVWSWRLIVTGRGHCPLLARELRNACRDDADEALAAVCRFLCALARARRHRLMVNPPGCLALTCDEAHMLAMIAAAQHREREVLDIHLEWIARSAFREPVRQSVDELAAILDAHRLRLPATTHPEVPRHRHPRPPVPALHGDHATA